MISDLYVNSPSNEGRSIPIQILEETLPEDSNSNFKMAISQSLYNFNKNNDDKSYSFHVSSFYKNKSITYPSCQLTNDNNNDHYKYQNNNIERILTNHTKNINEKTISTNKFYKHSNKSFMPVVMSRSNFNIHNNNPSPSPNCQPSPAKYPNNYNAYQIPYYDTTGKTLWDSINNRNVGNKVQPSLNDQPNTSSNIYIFPTCSCDTPRQYDESIDGPFYSQLGVGRSVEAVKEMMMKRMSMRVEEVRVERLKFTGKEGRNSQGCPIAKWILRRSSSTEKVLVTVRQIRYHHCENAVIVIGVCLWDGMPNHHTDSLYDYLKDVLPEHGEVAERKCGSNDKKTCACQGDDELGGASFSFGCSWSMYYNGCKFARSLNANKFHLKSKDKQEEEVLSHYLQTMATLVSPIFKKVAPLAYQNQVHHEVEARDCRLGYQEGRPWSGVTSVVDFSAHAHRDTNNMHHGCTTILTLTKHRGLGLAEDEQLHVLPSYTLDNAEISRPGVEVLRDFPTYMRVRSTPFVCKNKIRAMKAKHRKQMREGVGLGEVHKKIISRVQFGVGRKRGRPPIKSFGVYGRRTKSSNDSFFSINYASHHQVFPNQNHFHDSVLKFDSAHKPSSQLTSERNFSDAKIKFYNTNNLSNGYYNIHKSYNNYNNNLSNNIDKILYNNNVSKLCNTHYDKSQVNNITDSNNYNNVSYNPEKNSYTSLKEFGNNKIANQRSTFLPQLSYFSPSSSQTSLHSLPSFSFFQSNIDNISHFYRQNNIRLNESETIGDHVSGNLQAGCTQVSLYSHQNNVVKSSVSNGPEELVKVEKEEFQSIEPNAYSCDNNNNYTIKSKSTEVTYSIPITRNSHTSVINSGKNSTNYKSPFYSIPQQANFNYQHFNRDSFKEPNNEDDRSLSCNNDVNKVDVLCTNENKSMNGSCEQTKNFVVSSNGLNQIRNIPFEQIYSFHKHPDLQQSIKDDNLAFKTGKKTDPYLNEMNHFNVSDNNLHINACPNPPEPESLCREVFTTNEDVFKDNRMGGVAIALTHGSLLFEVAKRELHATTAVKRPSRGQPTRISLVLYQHKNLNRSCHGKEEYERKCHEREKKKAMQGEGMLFKAQDDNHFGIYASSAPNLTFAENLNVS